MAGFTKPVVLALSLGAAAALQAPLHQPAASRAPTTRTIASGSPVAVVQRYLAGAGVEALATLATLETIDAVGAVLTDADRQP